jgi:CBS domain-containing protein
VNKGLCAILPANIRGFAVRGKEVGTVSLLRQGKAQSLTIYLGESDQWQGMPLYVAIVQLLRERGCAGATVTRAVAGYGAGSRLHESGAWRLSSDAPMVIQVVDSPERLRRLLPLLEEMLNGGLMTLHEVDVLKYTHARPRGLPTKLPVRQVMESSIATVTLDTPVSVIIDELLEAPFRVMPVVDEQRHLRGIISTGDLINAGVLPMRRGLVRTALELDDLTAEAVEAPLEQARRSNLTAQDIMNRQIRTVGPQQSIREAAEIMLTTGLRRLPVVEANGTLLGMVSRADLLQVIVTSPLMNSQASSGTQPLRRTSSLGAVLAQQQPIAEYITTDITTVGTQTPLAEVIDALILSPLKRVIVTDADGQVQGIISDVDVLERIQDEARPGVLGMLAGWARGKPGRLPTGVLRTSLGKARVAADIMNRNVVTVSATATVQETIEKMIATGTKILPVLNTRGQLIGVVGRSDLLKVLLEG